MATLGRTVRVSGLPTDVEDGRLKDKLFIHFLRASNGGGEIDSVIIVKATPPSALITFEDSGVSQRVIQRSRHILDVDGVKYRLTATEQPDSLDPDQIIISLSATLDYRRLPGGVEAITRLNQNHRDVHIYYTSSEGGCRLSGAYSTVQAALAQLLGRPGGSEPAENKDTDEATPSGSGPAQTAEQLRPLELKDQSRKPNNQREQRKKNPTEGPPEELRDLTPGGSGWEDPAQPGTAALQSLATSLEDFSLIVDADMFQYLQKSCRDEYQSILRQYDVEVVDMTSQGLTTLFLQDASAAREEGGQQERLELAKKAISKFYHENETKTRRTQLPKVVLSSKGDLKRTVEGLSARYPDLLLNEDERYLYIVGSSSDVSEAKQFLLEDRIRVREETEEEARESSPYASGSSAHADEDRVPLTVGSLDERTHPFVRADEDERRAEGARRYKIAARFKESGMGTLGIRPADLTLRAGSSVGRQTRHGPMLGHDVLSDTAGTSGEAASRAGAQSTGRDILFRTGYAPSSFASMQTALNPDLMDSRPKSGALPFISPETNMAGSTPPPPPAGSGPTLKRTSSFSGMPQKKCQVLGQKSQDDSSKSTVRSRGRSSSFSTHKSSDRQEVHTAELTVSALIWQHIKKAYKTLVEDLTSDVQVKERCSEGSTDLTVTLRGANSSKVISCQLSLQKLVDSVVSDLSVQELRLSELGVTDAADETLQACCSEVRSRFKKVTIQLCKDKLFLIGPQLLCSQVGATLREVFSGALGEIPDRNDSPSAISSTWAFPNSLLMNEDQITNLHFNRKSQVIRESKTGQDDGTSRSWSWQTTYRSDFREIDQPLARNDPLLKERVKLTGSVETDGQKTDPVGCVNGVWSTPAGTEKEGAVRTARVDDIGQEQAEESRSGQRCTCVCGESGAPMMRTKCGVTMCSKCLDTLHSTCRVCHEMDQKSRSIPGKMLKSKLSITVPGHNKNCAIKITYRIPDGIQGEGHPSPGKPFQGGTFEAYLPECEKTRKLLPRLEKAFRQGLTFTVTGRDKEARVTWDCIPHKTSLQGGKSGNGYPDSSYLMRLSEVLTSHGIEELPVKYKE